MKEGKNKSTEQRVAGDWWKEEAELWEKRSRSVVCFRGKGRSVVRIGTLGKQQKGCTRGDKRNYGYQETKFKQIQHFRRLHSSEKYLHARRNSKWQVVQQVFLLLQQHPQPAILTNSRNSLWGPQLAMLFSISHSSNSSNFFTLKLCNLFLKNVKELDS